MPKLILAGIQLDATSIYKKTLPSLMRVEAKSNEGTSTGTAFLAIKDGIAVTCWHVIKDAKKVTVYFPDGEAYDSSGVIDKDERRDIAIIRVKVAGRPLLEFGQGAETGQRVYAIGSPRGLDFSLSDGLISSLRQIDGFKQLQFSAAVSPGNSGGPLVNADGKVLGVIAWQVENGQNLNFATLSSYVQGLDSTLPTTPWERVLTTTKDQPPVESKISVKDTTDAIKQLWQFASRLHIETEMMFVPAQTAVSPLFLEQRIRFKAAIAPFERENFKAGEDPLLTEIRGLLLLGAMTGERLNDCSGLAVEDRGEELAQYITVFRLVEPGPDFKKNLLLASNADMRSKLGELLVTKLLATKDQKGWRPGDMLRTSRKRFEGGFSLLSRLAFDIDSTGVVFGFLVDPEDQSRLIESEISTPPFDWGFRKGDIIKKVEDQSVNSFEEMKRMILDLPNKSASVIVLRNNQDKKLKVDFRKFLR